MNIITETLSAESLFLKLDTYFQGLRLHVAWNKWQMDMCADSKWPLRSSSKIDFSDLNFEIFNCLVGIKLVEFSKNIEHKMGARGGVVVKTLRYKPTGRGFIPDGVIGIFQWHNLSCCVMALGSTQPLTEMITRCISWGLRRPVRKADNLTNILCRCREIWES